MTALPNRLTIEPLGKPPDTSISVPGSKSITNRALVLAALATRSLPITIVHALRSEDTEVMVNCLQNLGFKVLPDWDAASIRVEPVSADRVIPAERADLYVANSGTTMRFLTALVSLGQGRYRLHGMPRMHERPIEDLLDALRQLGVGAASESGNGCPPVIIESNGWQNGGATVRGNVSSQFLSGLMLAAPFASHETLFSIDETMVSRPYLDMTESMMHGWKLQVGFKDRSRSFCIPAPQQSDLEFYLIEPDASAASYFFGAAAIMGGRISIPGLRHDSLQGDVRFVEVLDQMGCRVEYDINEITVRGGPLHGIDVDMNAISDTVMTLGAVACFAEGPTTIRNVGHIRHKETDRLSALATELRRIGAEVEEFPDGMRIEPRPLHGGVIETYNDHRMAMSLALVGLRVPGIVIKDPSCVAKTYPAFFTDLEKLR